MNEPSGSALYVGTVQHRRSEPEHRFSYRVAMCLVDLDEVTDVVSQHPLWSLRRGRPIQFRRSDYLGNPEVDLGLAVRRLAAERTGPLKDGPVRLLTHLRAWGWCFNPVSLYYCFDRSDRLQAVVASVTNTPWGERHDYVLEADGDRVEQTLPKALHVSPFIAPHMNYRFAIEAPGERLDLRIDVLDGATVRLATGLHLARRRLDRRAMTSLMIRYPLMTWRVSAAIYWQAARLAGRRATFHPHPRRVLEPRRSRR